MPRSFAVCRSYWYASTGEQKIPGLVVGNGEAPCARLKEDAVRLEPKVGTNLSLIGTAKVAMSSVPSGTVLGIQLSGLLYAEELESPVHVALPAKTD